MKITVFNGSPKAERGNTHVMVEAFLQGAQEVGVDVENIFLVKHDIKPCRACGSCWTKTPGQCIHHDDMDALLPKILDSEIIGFATPLYVDNVTGLMKNFMDRLVIIGDPHWEKDEHGECRHVRRTPKPSKIAVIANCGYPEQSHFQVLRLLFRRIARNIHAELIAEIYRGGGGLLTVRTEALQPVIEQYKSLLRQAGREVSEQGKLSEAAITKLEQPLLPGENYVDDYLQRVNQLWDTWLSKPDQQTKNELGSRVLV